MIHQPSWNLYKKNQDSLIKNFKGCVRHAQAFIQALRQKSANSCATGGSGTDHMMVAATVLIWSVCPKNNISFEFSLGIQTLNIYSLPESEKSRLGMCNQFSAVVLFLFHLIILSEHNKKRATFVGKARHKRLEAVSLMGLQTCWKP